MFLDRHGYEIGTDSQEAAEAYSVGLDRFLALTGRADEALDKAITHDPEFSLGWATLAAFRHFGGDRVGTEAALAEARRWSARATDRERSYLNLLETAVDAQVKVTLSAAAEHLAAFPADTLAYEQVMLASHFGGGGPLERAEALRLFREAQPSVKNDWAFLGVSAFVHQEADLLEDAERLARRSLAQQPANADAMHSVAHVHFERGAHKGGSEELASWMGQYDDDGPFHIHFTWHLALHDLGLGEWERSLDRYRQTITPNVGGPGTISDAPTLLWRMMLRGYDPAKLPWSDLVEVAGPMASTPSFRYGDWHVAIALAGARSDQALAELEDALQARAAGRPQAPAIVRVVRGFRAYAAGDHAAAAELLDMPADHIPYLGGSRAQREVIEDTAIDSWIRAGETTRARQMLEDRLTRRPSETDVALLDALQ